MIYDIFYVSKTSIDIEKWNKFRERFPISQKIENLENFNAIKSKAFTKFFWVVWDDLVVCEDFTFDYRVPKWDEEYIHVFKNANFYDGVALIPKSADVSTKEFNSRFYINKKEIDIIASVPNQYDKFYIEKYEDYVEALEKTSTEMFWMLSQNLKIDSSFTFDFYFSHHNFYDRNQNHAFIHRVRDLDSYNGIFLCSVNQKLSKKEIDYRFPVNRKEWDIVASGPIVYNQYCLTSYKDYLEKLETSNTELFWNIPSDVVVDSDFKFDLYFRHDNDYDRKMNHVFKNADYFDGITLLSKHKPITEREFNRRFLVDKKEWDILASRPAQYDIVFISYNESNAEENYARLLKRFPWAKRIDKVKGIHQAHIEAAKLVSTPLFWVVDGDAEIVDDFNFSIDYIPYYDVGNRDVLHKTVQVWRSKNPINGLEYGYGGVKLFPRDLVLNMDTNTADMTTSISDYFKPAPAVSNITRFNTDPFTTWRSAFRECAKLSSKVIDSNYDSETDERLQTWCSKGLEEPFGKYAIAGAKLGKEFGEKYSGIIEIMTRINDFEWLETQFNKWQSTNV